MTFDIPPRSFSEITLERLRIMAGTRISRQVLEDAEIETVMEMMVDQMIVQLRSFLLGHKLVEKQHRLVVEYPATPWDHFKAAWLPRLGGAGRWYLRRHPVRKTAEAVSVDFAEYATFPENNTVYPKGLGPVHFMQQVAYEPNEAARAAGGYWNPPAERRIWPTDSALLEAAIVGLAALLRAGLTHATLFRVLHEADVDPEIAGALHKRIQDAG